MRKGRRRFFVWVAVLLALLALAYKGLQPVQTAPRTVGVEVGQIAPDFTLTTLSGSRVRLWSLRGQPVMVNFFASWCVPCNEEAPELESVARTTHGLRLLGVDLLGSEVSIQAVRDFVHRHGITYPVLLDANNNVSNQYQVAFAPTTYFIDRQGVIQDVETVRLTAGDIRQALAKIGVRGQ